jgi:oxygen-dependent protoporphyrinogen oxidase
LSPFLVKRLVDKGNANLQFNNRSKSQPRKRIPSWFIIMQASAEVLIIGAGLSGLAAATFLKHKDPDISLLVIEQGDHPGGAVASYLEEGYLAEAGAHGFLDNSLESRVLIHEAGLTKEVEKAPLSEFVRYICLDGQLQLIPQTPGKILKAPLLPLTAKLRVLADLWKRPLPDQPSVAQWVEHRFGKKLLPFADAVFTGTYAGDIERLKLEAVMPGLHTLEQTHGSVLKGAFYKMRAARKKRRFACHDQFSCWYVTPAPGYGSKTHSKSRDYVPHSGPLHCPE